MLPRGDKDLGYGRVVRDRDDLGTGHHDLPHDAVGELHRTSDDDALALLQDAFSR